MGLRDILRHAATLHELRRSRNSTSFHGMIVVLLYGFASAQGSHRLGHPNPNPNPKQREASAWLVCIGKTLNRSAWEDSKSLCYSSSI